MATATAAKLQALTDRLLVKDPREHQAALSELAEAGDDRVIPHLIELAVIDQVANRWDDFGVPEVLRRRVAPRYLELPEVAWPGVIDALCTVAEPDYDSGIAFLQWESWYSQQDIEPLDGFAEWKQTLFRRYLPPVGNFLDTEPLDLDLQAVRWGHSDRSCLAPLNGPTFVPGEDVAAGSEGGPRERYLAADHLVYGFEVGGQAYAVPRFPMIPHEMLNATLQGIPVSLTYCALCNGPILYDRRVDGDALTFGTTSFVTDGNKIMFDEETESLWSQHRGVPVGGEYLERDGRLDVLPCTQTDWGDWQARHPESLALDLDTGYDFDYAFYDGNLGYYERYWEDEEVVQLGVRVGEGPVSDKETVFGVTGGDLGLDDAEAVHVYPHEAVVREEPIIDEFAGVSLLVLADGSEGVAVYEAPPEPIERDGARLVDGTGREWTIAHDALVAGDDRLARVPGRQSLWYAFRSKYDDITLVDG